VSLPRSCLSMSSRLILQMIPQVSKPMLLKIIFRTIILLLVVFQIETLAQSKMIEQCYNTKGEVVKNKSDAEYCVVGKQVKRLPKPPRFGDSTLTYVDTVKAYYKSGALKYTRYYSDSSTVEGPFVELFENGKTKEKGFYKNDKKYGLAFYSDESGRQRSVLRYDGKETFDENGFLIVSYWDSSGNMLVKNGDGKCICTLVSGRTEIGNVVKGKRDSVWNEYSDAKLILTEKYEAGKLIYGERLDTGEPVRYTDRQQQPEFIGGYEADIVYKSKSKVSRAGKAGWHSGDRICFICRHKDRRTNRRESCQICS
jgi:antitoxin component YwqK of YwqJK toxin-antitoxin module